MSAEDRPSSRRAKLFLQSLHLLQSHPELLHNLPRNHPRLRQVRMVSNTVILQPRDIEVIPPLRNLLPPKPPKPPTLPQILPLALPERIPPKAPLELREVPPRKRRPLAERRHVRPHVEKPH